MFKKLSLLMCTIVLTLSTLPAAQAYPPFYPQELWDLNDPISVKPWHLVGLTMHSDKRTLRCDWAYIVTNLETGKVLESYYATNYGDVFTACPRPANPR